MSVTIRFRIEGAFTPEAFRRRRERMAVVLLNQVQTRIVEGGDEEEKFAPLDFPRPDGSQSNPLYSTGSHLLQSLSATTGPGELSVGSNFIGARVLALGTEGKGGALPSIRPVEADALFIPLSPRAAKSIKKGGKRFGTRRRRGKKELVELEPDADFLLRQKVDIRPRNPFRLSAADRQALAEAFADDRD